MKKITIVFIYMLGFMLFTKNVIAGNLSVQITQLPTYVNTSNLKLSYTASQANNEEIKAQFIFQPEGGVWGGVGGEVTGPVGSAETNGGLIKNEGKYYFKVIATSNGENSESLTETIVDWTAPSPVSEYGKSRVSGNTYKIDWKNPTNDDFDHVIIYRSEIQNFTANSATELTKVAGNKDTKMSYEDNGLKFGTEYFYAIRAIDKAGNSSSLAGDGGSVTTVIEEISGKTPSGGLVLGTKEEVLRLPTEEPKGEILGGSTEEKQLDSQKAQGMQIEDVLKKENRNWLWLGLGIIILGLYFLYSRRSSKD